MFISDIRTQLIMRKMKKKIPNFKYVRNKLFTIRESLNNVSLKLNSRR